MSENKTQKTESKSIDEKKVEKKKIEKTKRNISSNNIARFGKGYFVDLNNELKKYSTEHVKAYSAGTSESKANGYFVLICNPKYTPRTNVTKFYKELSGPHLPSLIDSGRIIMPDGKSIFFCFLYRDEIGDRVYETDNNIALGWKSDATIERLIIPIVMSLQSLQKRDVTHGNIRATNLYNGDEKKSGAFKLGECLSVPPSFNQPVVYETIERAMASPIGRGEGTIGDDLYALGVLAAKHVRNFDPLREKTDDEIISAKVVNSSYSALISTSDRLPSGISELLRGLLMDDRKSRWSLDDLLGWLDGKRLGTNQPVKVKKAARAVTLDDTSFYYARTFAHRLLQKPKEAVTLVENHQLKHWIERSLGNDDINTRYDLALELSKESSKGGGYWDRLLPRISIALDPRAPIRYRSLSLHLNALGNSISESFIDKKGLSSYTELFSNGIIDFWISVSADLNYDMLEQTQTLEKIKSYLKKNTISDGIERCLYFLNPSIHCLSPLVIDYFVSTPKEYILTLEKLAKDLDGSYPERIIDKHAACFLISKENRLIEPYNYNLSSQEKHRNILGALQVLSTIQKFDSIKELPYLTDWVCSTITPLINRYHDQEQHAKIKKEISKKKSNGNLSEILNILENTDKVKNDQLSYRKAMIKYKGYEYEEVKIKSRLKNPKLFSQRSGQEWATTISGIISVLVILGFVMVYFGTGVPT